MKKNSSEYLLQHNSISREQMINLLCQALCQKSSSETLNEFSDGDWEYLMQIARQQGVSMLLYWNVKTLSAEGIVPDNVMKRLHEVVLWSARRNMIMLHEVELVLRTLHSKGLDVIPLKGLYLIENVYQDISMRSLSDLDLLVQRDKVNVAISCLQELGYELETYFNSQDENQDIKHVPPMKKPGGSYVEIHWTILEEDEPFTIDIMGFWERAVPSELTGVDVLALSVEDLLLHLCVHLGYQHHLDFGLRGLYDIAEVLKCFNDKVDWGQIIDIAMQWGAERVIWLVLKLAEELLEADIPRNVYTSLVAEAIPDDMLVEAKKQLLAGEEQSFGVTPDLAKLATVQSFRSKLKVMASRVFLPRQVLARLYNISPNSLAIFGCYFKRFYDLVRQYGSVLKDLFRKDKAVMVAVSGKKRNQYLIEWMGKPNQGK